MFSTKTNFFFALLTFSILIFAPESFTLESNCNFKVNVDLNLRNNGFHRNLSYSLTFVNDYDEILTWDNIENCHVGLEQAVPAGLYFRPDDVGSQPSIVKSPVNIEDSAEDAKELMIHLFAPINEWTVKLHLLLHARYHAATADGGSVRNVIEPPKLYLNCKDDKLLCDYSANSVTNNFCQKDAVCTWTEIPIVVEPNKLIWDVPVGNTEDYYVVAVGTAVSVVAGSLYLLKTIHEYMLNTRRIKSKIK